MAPSAIQEEGRERAHVTAERGARCLAVEVLTRNEAAQPSAPQVQLGDQLITLVPLDQLERQQQDAREESDSKSRHAAELVKAAEGKFMEAGAVLVPHASEWNPSATVQPLIANALDLMARIDRDDSATRQLSSKRHAGLGAIWGRVGDARKSRSLQTDRDDAASQMGTLLLAIGRAARTPSVETADHLLDEARRFEAEASQWSASARASADRAHLLDDEIQRRKSARDKLGFDSLYTAAYLTTYGPQPVQSPLILKRGEQAYVSVSSRLARRRTRIHYVGGSQGLSFPIGHTGIRYRVGTFRGQPVQQQYLGQVDTGTLVLTNQRLAFIGTSKSAAVPITKILHVECYSDGLAVFQEGRENPNYFLIEHPQYLLLFLNYLLEKEVD
jgi:hypothetical protein